MTGGLAVRRRFVLVLGFLTGLAAVSIDMSLPAIPEMVATLSTEMRLGQLIVGLFLAGIGFGQIPAGLLSDRFGRMPVLYGGVGLFVVAGMACAAAGTIEQMLLARFVQGLGASVGIVVSRAIVRDIASGRQAARRLSLMVMIFTTAPMIAPVLGSFLVTAIGWRMPFVVIAVFGACIMGGITAALTETHRPVREHHFLRQLWLSMKEFAAHPQSRFGLLLILLPPAGYMSLITGSSALVIEIYGYPVAAFGFIFALAGLSIFAGSMTNRRLLLRFSTVRVTGIGAALMSAAAAQLIAMTWLAQVPFWWLWGCVCLFMFATGMVVANATALALDPVPGVAGVAASIVGTVQNLAATGSAIASGLLYDGSIRTITFMMGFFGLASGFVYLLRHRIGGGELATADHAPGPDS